MNNKEDSLKEKFKLALISTAKVISDDYKINDKNIDKKSGSSNENLLKINSLSNKNDFVKLRAKADSAALKKKFSNKEVFKKNLPQNSSCKSLYETAEKIRYEILGSRMLKGIEKNLSENYYQKINLEHKDQLKIVPFVRFVLLLII